MRTGTHRRRVLCRCLRSCCSIHHLVKRKAALKGLSPEHRCRITEKLGFVSVPPSTFGAVQEILSASELYLRERPERFERATDYHKPYAFATLPDDEVYLESPFFRFALDPHLISAISRYLGAVPVLWRIEYWHANKSTQKQDLFGSQLFHCDDGDLKQVKVFIYLSDVTERDGPLTIITADMSEKIRDWTTYRFQDRLSDDMVYSVAGDEGQMQLLAGRGTTVLVDTSRCLHYGSRMHSGHKPRFALFFHYLVPGAFKLPLDFPSRAPYRRLSSNRLSNIHNMVLGAV